MSELTYYQINRELILNRAKDYYENYRNLSEEENNRKRECWKTDTTIYLKKKKQKLKEYQQNYREAKKSKYNNE